MVPSGTVVVRTTSEISKASGLLGACCIGVTQSGKLSGRVPGQLPELFITIEVLASPQRLRVSEPGASRVLAV